MNVLKSFFIGERAFLTVVCFLFAFSLMAQTEETRFFSFCLSSPTVTDHQGNRYRTVQIGSQCWMAENMRCTTSPTGKKWYSNPYFSASQPEFAAYYALPTDLRHGVLYNWAAALDLSDHYKSAKTIQTPVRGICPGGWHLPSNDDWDVLFNTLGGHKKAGEMMKAPTQQWTPHLTLDRYNLGFDATPAGSYTEKGHQYAGLQTSFWSADNFSHDQAWCCTVYDYKNEGYNYLEYKCYGHSVRCVKDNDELRIKN